MLMNKKGKICGLVLEFKYIGITNIFNINNYENISVSNRTIRVGEIFNRMV